MSGAAPGGRISMLRHVRDALVRHPVARRLPLSFDAERLRADLARIDASWWKPHQGPYHNGRWDVVGLWTPGGEIGSQRSFGAPFAPTEALRRAPYLKEVMEAIPGEKSRVRLMRLRPGGHIFRHSDPVHQVAHGSIRVHVPITTDPAVFFVVNGIRLAMEAGEAWQVDVRFPHEVRNFAGTDRVHMVIDAHGSDLWDRLAARAVSPGAGSLARYYAVHALPAPLKRLLRLGN